ncbi:unnamed protein product, partial [marine sediment metagenome]
MAYGTLILAQGKKGGNMARRYPQWVTPDRQTHLVRLFLDNKGFCVYGHKRCLIPEHHYEVYIEYLIADWKADDKAQRKAEWQAEREQLHKTADRHYPLSGQFSAVSKDIFFAEQPLYYLVGLGISGLTFKPFAQIRLASSFVSLYIDLGNTLKGLSKSKRRKAIRYGKPLSYDIDREIGNICKLAVKHYLA